MKKKITLTLLSLFVIVLLFFIFFPLIDFGPKENGKTIENCPFCNPLVIDKQQYYEGQLIRVLYNYSPIVPGHSLIIPKRHVSRFEELTIPEATEMILTVNKIQKAFEEVYHTSDYFMAMQNGKKAGQTVFHVHLHMIPRKEFNMFDKLSLWFSFLFHSNPYGSPLKTEEIIQQKAPLEKAMQNLSEVTKG
jgi:diadenosine tetraphosphate (Ap4A) HIT family hydrolase